MLAVAAGGSGPPLEDIVTLITALRDHLLALGPLDGCVGERVVPQPVATAIGQENKSRARGSGKAMGRGKRKKGVGLIKPQQITEVGLLQRVITGVALVIVRVISYPDHTSLSWHERCPHWLSRAIPCCRSMCLVYKATAKQACESQHRGPCRKCRPTRRRSQGWR